MTKTVQTNLFGQINYKHIGTETFSEMDHNLFKEVQDINSPNETYGNPAQSFTILKAEKDYLLLSYELDNELELNLEDVHWFDQETYEKMELHIKLMKTFNGNYTYQDVIDEFDNIRYNVYES